MPDLQAKVTSAKRLYNEYDGLNRTIEYLQTNESPNNYMSTLHAIRRDIVTEYNELYLIVKMSARLHCADFDAYQLPNLLAKGEVAGMDM